MTRLLYSPIGPDTPGDTPELAKAKELVEKFFHEGLSFKISIACAIIAVKDKIEAIEEIHSKLRELGNGNDRLYITIEKTFWQTVLTHLENMKG